MGRKKYLHISYIAGTGDGDYAFKSCLVTITNADYDELYRMLRKHYCEITGEDPQKKLLLSIVSLNEISKSTYKLLNGGKI